VMPVQSSPYKTDNCLFLYHEKLPDCIGKLSRGSESALRDLAEFYSNLPCSCYFRAVHFVQKHLTLFVFLASPHITNTSIFNPLQDSILLVAYM
jgi:hypothetical protein